MNTAPRAPAPERSALQQHLDLLALYNLWATRRLFAALESVPDEHYRRDVGLFFKSIHGTLNHLLLGEHELWFKRFTGAPPDADIQSLAQEVEPDRACVKQRLLEGAATWPPALQGWSAPRWAQDLEYRSTVGEALKLPFAATLMHVFNHGTHHRGQITAALTMLCHPCPELDLVAMLRDQRR
jgi:uncharacterized damage-inducible protein DinB